MSELSEGGTDEDREQGDMLLEGRDRLAELRERRRDLENGSGQRVMSSGESERLQQETQAAAFDLAHEAMSAEAVKAFMKLKRAEYAAKHAPLVAPTGADMVVRPPGRVCRPERFADQVADSYDSPSAEDSEFASEVSGERSDSGTDAARQCFWLSDSTGEAEESTADGMHEEGARTPDVNALILATVSDMASAGTTPKEIRAWLRKKTGKKTKLKDVHNMFQDLKKAYKRNMSDVERTESILEEFASEQEGNTAQIFVDKARGVAVAVTLQSAGMKRSFAAFPEVLMVDSTHDTNCNGYKLFSFVVHDCFGKVKE
ncbi:hypothetical protein PR003_g5362 [Phytophthora rubi]|uniref:ZSWIM1/3 RNaseH-like domain-containing protein n=1 Tax=Phytophthora rubi TaxID=129364 RepID=A0A6A4FJT6_9STRA|nr:hypothetical protein PR003_g5362 [Phytophthora rubi]